jgi:RNA polymerase-binding transcription factor
MVRPATRKATSLKRKPARKITAAKKPATKSMAARKPVKKTAARKTARIKKA